MIVVKAFKRDFYIFHVLLNKSTYITVAVALALMTRRTQNRVNRGKYPHN